MGEPGAVAGVGRDVLALLIGCVNRAGGGVAVGSARLSDV